MKLIYFLLIVFCVSCASNKPSGHFVNSESYQKRAALKANYSSKEAQLFLKKKLAIPKDIKIAVVKQNPFVATEDNSHFIKNIAGKDKRIKEITIVPSMLMPDEPTLQNYRDVAATMQANFILVVQSQKSIKTKFHLFKPNEAKSTVTVEALIIDVATGVIPFSSVATNSLRLKKKKDFNQEEFYLRTIQTTEDKSLREVFEAVGAYFNEMK